MNKESKLCCEILQTYCELSPHRILTGMTLDLMLDICQRYSFCGKKFGDTPWRNFTVKCYCKDESVNLEEFREVLKTEAFADLYIKPFKVGDLCTNYDIFFIGSVVMAIGKHHKLEGKFITVGPKSTEFIQLVPDDTCNIFLEKSIRLIYPQFQNLNNVNFFVNYTHEFHEHLAIFVTKDKTDISFDMPLKIKKCLELYKTQESANNYCIQLVLDKLIKCIEKEQVFRQKACNPEVAYQLGWDYFMKTAGKLAGNQIWELNPYHPLYLPIESVNWEKGWRDHATYASGFNAGKYGMTTHHHCYCSSPLPDAPALWRKGAEDGFSIWKEKYPYAQLESFM